jgi:hypothetical protein
MSTSEYERRILTDSNDVMGQPKALDALSARIVMSNLNHLADEFAQVRAALSGTTASLSGKAGYLTSGTPAAIDTPYQVCTTSFPICVRAAGQSYKFRVRIGGASANGASSATFYATLSAGGEAPALTTDATDATFVTTPTTSTSAAWLTGASQGAAAYTTMMEMSPAQVATCMSSFATRMAIGGDAASVTVPWVTLTVFASTTNVSHVPRLYGVSLAEVIGL